MKGVQRQVSFIYDSQTERYNKFVEEKSEYIDKIPSQYIASYLGIQPETLSRIRRKSM
jgi:ribosomal protein L10